MKKKTIARLLAEMKAEMDTKQERMAIEIGSLASQTKVNQNKLDKMDDGQEEMKAMLEACLE
jgi:ATP/maltotriose-dependent transcriptional regulator MalT